MGIERHVSILGTRGSIGVRRKVKGDMQESFDSVKVGSELVCYGHLIIRPPSKIVIIPDDVQETRTLLNYEINESNIRVRRGLVEVTYLYTSLRSRPRSPFFDWPSL